MIACWLLPQNKKDFQRLNALEGTWERKGTTKRSFEEWKKVDAENLAGRSYYLKDGDTVLLEQVKLSRKNGQIVYIAVVPNQNGGRPIPFFLVSTTKNTYVFENLRHDFPKRVVYELFSKDSLHAWIDGGITDSAKRADFYFRKLQ